MLAHKGDKYINSQRFLKIIVNFIKFWVVLVRAGKKAALLQKHVYGIKSEKIT